MDDDDVAHRLQLSWWLYYVHNNFNYQQLTWTIWQRLREHYLHVFNFRFFVRSQASTIPSESGRGPTRLILYSNLPITCQGVARDNSPIFCRITFTIRAGDDIAMRQRTPYDSGPRSIKDLCTYQLYEDDWKPDEGYAYDGNKSLDIVAKVHFVSFATCFFHKYASLHASSVIETIVGYSFIDFILIYLAILIYLLLKLYYNYIDYNIRPKPKVWAGSPNECRTCLLYTSDAADE